MSINVEIKNGVYDHLTSGTLVIDATDLTSILLKSELEDLKVIFKFENEEKEPENPRKIAKVIDNTTLEIIFINYNNILGSFNSSYWEIGSIKNRKLYFTYVIYGLSETKMKKINYSFFLGEEVTNG